MRVTMGAMIGGPSWRATLVTLIAVAIGGCGRGKDPPINGSKCPNDLPTSCPSRVPSYANDVAPILLDLCGACHTAGGIEANQSFDTYVDVQARRTGIWNQLHNCLMPPADQAQPTVTERKAILDWIVCDAPDN